MKIKAADPHPSKTSRPCPIAVRRFGIAVFAGLAVLLCSGSTSPTGCQGSSLGNIGPSNGEVIGAAVGIGAVIAIAIIV
ncbi:MAG TPA: hypothetical protein VFE01_06810, partial [Terracidiphilus sp.]|nr:hypothetical protein [Terracidiphilus sp.]